MGKVSIKQKILLILFGICLTFIFLEGFLRLGGFILLSLRDKQNQGQIVEANKNIYKILCIGESTTMLGGVDSYPRLLEEVLNKGNNQMSFRVINKGLPGTNTAVILSKIKGQIATYKPDMVIVMMGVNDDDSTPVYEENFGTKIQLFLTDFRVVKLFGLLSAHLHSKMSEKNVFNEEGYKKEIRRYPRREWAYKRLGEYYINLHQYKNFEEIFLRAVDKQPRKAWSYEGLGDAYIRQNKYAEAENLFKKAIEINPSKPFGYKLLYDLYEQLDRLEEMENILKAAIESYPDNYDLLIVLGQYYKDSKNFVEAEKIFKDAIELEPDNSGGYQELGFTYGLQGEFEKLDMMFDKAIDLKGEHIPLNLSKWYLERKEFNRAAEFLKKVLVRHPSDDRVWRGLANVYERWGKPSLAKEYYDKAEALSLDRGNASTQINYKRFVEVVQEDGIQVVSMQYPLRSIKPLKRMLKNFSGIIFISNEENFQGKLKTEKYEKYFTDSFGGDFGHCTPEGNRLIAENIAEVLSAELQQQ